SGLRLTKGARYLVCLSNEPWFYEPWVNDPLRVETVDGLEVLVGPDELLVTGLAPGGVRYGSKFEAGLWPRQLNPSLAEPITYDEYLELLTEAMRLEETVP